MKGVTEKPQENRFLYEGHQCSSNVTEQNFANCPGINPNSKVSWNTLVGHSRGRRS